MHLSKIPDDAASDATLDEVRATLATVASHLDARFVQAGSALASAYEMVERLITSLEGVTSALDRDAGDAAMADMRATAERLARLPQLQQARRRDLDTIRETTRQLCDHVGQIHRTLSFLRICGLNIKVAAAGAEEFSGFADTMFARLDLGEGQIGSVRQEATQLADKIATMVEAETRLAAECAKVIPHVPRKLAEDARALQRHQTDTAALAGRIADSARAIRAKLAAALGAIQIGDITRQRLEHVCEAIPALAAFLAERPEVDAEAIEAHVVALLAAQAADATEDFRREARVLTESLHGIAPDAARLLALREEGGPGDGGAFLLHLERDIAEVASVTAQLRDADAQTDRLGQATSDIAASLALRLKAVRRVQSDVEQMAWNTGLRCRRMGEDGLALAAIATEIRAFSTHLEVVAGRVGQNFEGLETAAGAIRAGHGEDERGDAGRSLADALASIRAGGERARASLAGLDGDTSAMIAVLRKSSERVDCEAELGGLLAGASARLAECGREADEVAGPLEELLGLIAGRYTMAREREVHRRFAGGGEMVVVPDAGEDEDLFEDALF